MGDQGSWRITGFRFKPTQQELMFLLKNKVEGKEISTLTDSVVEKTLYGGEGTEPWNVFSDVDEDKWDFYDESLAATDSKRVVYVLTKLSSMSEKKKSRTAGCGTWEGQNQKQVRDGDKILGYVRTLNYVVPDKSVGVGKGSWYMHEYSLSKESLKGLGFCDPSTNDYVICRVIRKMADDSKPCRGVKRKNDNHQSAPAVDGAGEPISEQQHCYGVTTTESSSYDYGVFNGDYQMGSSYSQMINGDYPPMEPNNYFHNYEDPGHGAMSCEYATSDYGHSSFSQSYSAGCSYVDELNNLPPENNLSDWISF